MLEKEIALFGIFRSGTNYTRTLLEWNYYCKLTNDEFGWKHGFYPVIVGGCKIEYPLLDTVFVTKNPFSSINSLYSYFHTKGKNILASSDWRQFLRQKFIIYDSFQKNSPQYRFANVVEFWNSMNWNYSSIKKTGMTATHVRYESLLDDPVAYSKQVADQLQLKPRFSGVNNFKEPSMVTRNMNDKPRKSEGDYLTDRKFNRQAYASMDYFKNFGADDIEFVLDNIDMHLVKLLGYENEVIVARKLLEGS